MKYVLKNTLRENLMETILFNRGITDLNRVLNPDNSDDTDTSKIINIREGIDLLKKHLNGKIALLVDSDVDGMTSSAIIYKYIKSINNYVDIHCYYHPGKQHGLTNEFMDFVASGNFDLVIAPDSSSNDVENIEKLKVEFNADILIIDHHEVDKTTEYGVIINNQICSNTNSNLTGAGMTYLFCKELDKEYQTGILDELSNLAMLGQVGDCSDVLENEVRNLCLTSIKNIKNKFMKTIYEENGKGIYNLSIKDLSFGGIIPMINAVMRIGDAEEKRIVFEALADIDNDRRFLVTKRKLNKEIRKYEMIDFDMNLYEYVIDLCTKIRARQSKVVTSVIKDISSQYNEKSDIQIFIMKNNEEAKGVTGLIANKLVDLFGKPAIVCWFNEEKNLYVGSLRGNEKILPDFKKWCSDTELFELVQGHANAAGVMFTKENLQKIINKTYNIESTGSAYEVDYIYKSIPKSDIKLVCSYDCLWNNGVEKPLFAFEKITVPTNSIKWSKNTLRISVSGVTLVKFKTPEEEYNDLVNFKDEVTLNIIGEFEINEWNNYKFEQIMVKDYEVIENNDEYIDFSIFS